MENLPGVDPQSEAVKKAVNEMSGSKDDQKKKEEEDKKKKEGK